MSARATGRRTLPLLIVAAALAGLLSGVFRVGVDPSTDLVMLVLAVATLGISGVLLVDPGEPRSGVTPGVLWVLAGLIAAAAVSAAASGATFSSLLGVPGSSLGLVQWTCVALLGVGAACRTTDVRHVLLGAAPWIVGVEAALVVAQVGQGDGGAGTLANASYMSQVLLLMAPLVVWPGGEGSPSRSGGEWAIRWAVVGAGMVALVLAGTVTAAAVGALGLLAAVVLGRWRDPVRWARPAAAGVAALLLATAVVNVVRSYESPRSFLGTRPEMWSVSLELVSARPLVGHGPDAFRVASAPLAPEEMTIKEGGSHPDFGSLSADPHDIVLALLVHVGALGLALAAALAALVGRQWVLGRSDEAIGPLALGATLYVGAALMAPVPLQTLPLFATVVGASLPLRPGGRHGSKSARRAVVALSLAGLACGVVLLPYTVTRLWVGPQSAQPSAALRAEKAADAWRGDPFLYFLASWRWTAAGATDPHALDADAALRTISRATRLEPENPFYALDHAALLDAAGLADEDAVLEAYEHAVTLFPSSLEANLETSDFLVRAGRAEEAAAYVEKALRLGDGSPSVHSVAARYYSSVGDESRAADHRQKALALEATAPGGQSE